MSRKRRDKQHQLAVPVTTEPIVPSPPALREESGGASVIVPPNSIPEAPTLTAEKAMEVSLAKYHELYLYSTDVFLKENERFNRADEKAAKYSTMFVFLIGVIAYFEKWTFDRIKPQPDKYFDMPTEWPMMAVGGLALLIAGFGWFYATRVIMQRQSASRPLSKEVLEFFDRQNLLNIYDSFARRNIEGYEINKAITDTKYKQLAGTYRLMGIVLVLLVFLLVLYCLYSLF